MVNAESVGEFQPMVCFETLGRKMSKRFIATLKELRPFDCGNATQLFQGCVKSITDNYDPGFQSKPWAGICERFQR